MQSKKVLFVATVVKTHIMEFHLPYLKMFKEMGWETAVAAKNDYEDPGECNIPNCDKYYDIPFVRSPLRLENAKAYKMLKKLINCGKYDIIHCHTPVAAILTRLAAGRARRQGTRIIYTAHGFHFYKGGPLLNWLCFYPIEWLCSFMTDTLITINKEDYTLAKKHMHAKEIRYVPGVGVDLEKFTGSSICKNKKRVELEIPNGMVWLLSVGELISRKNHESLIRAVSELNNVYLTIAGRGELYNSLSDLISRLNLNQRVKLLGYRNDIAELCQAADIFALSSYQEGLPVAIMEAMASGLPVVCSNIRGNTDLIDENGGELFEPDSIESIKNAVIKIIERNKSEIIDCNLNKIQMYSLNSVLEEMRAIYFNY